MPSCSATSRLWHGQRLSVTQRSTSWPILHPLNLFHFSSGASSKARSIGDFSWYWASLLIFPRLPILTCRRPRTSLPTQNTLCRMRQPRRHASGCPALAFQPVVTTGKKRVGAKKFSLYHDKVGLGHDSFLVEASFQFDLNCFCYWKQ